MRYRYTWALAAGLLLLACRTDGERGEAAPQEHGGYAAPGAKQGQVERTAPGVGVEDTGAARVLAATRALAQGGLDAAKLAEQRASSPEVKAYATRAVAEYQSNLDALSDLAKAKKIDLNATNVQNDPVLRAHHDMVKDELDRLRMLSGTAFDAAYMTAQWPMQSLLVHLSNVGPQVSRDTDVGNVLRTVAQQGKERMNKANSVLPKACGGERPGWGGGAG
jgi:predicted outer membrane protein